jgi:hypothetical protein
MTRKGNAAFVGCAVAVTVAMLFYNYAGISHMAHENVRVYVYLYGTSIYEYHARTGRWPTRIDDLAETSLPLKMAHWKVQVEDEADVIVWPTDFKPNARDNAGTILAYHNKGLLVELGHTWVCWGDLRTEYIPTEELRAHLQAVKK